MPIMKFAPPQFQLSRANQSYTDYWDGGVECEVSGIQGSKTILSLL